MLQEFTHNNVLSRIVYGIAAILGAILCYFAFSSLWGCASSAGAVGISIAALGLCALAVTLIFIHKKKALLQSITKTRLPLLPVCVGLFLAAFLFKFLFFFYADTPLQSDFKMFYSLSNQISAGNLSYISNSYFDVWGYQIAFPYLMSWVSALFGDNLCAHIAVNCLFMAGANLFVFLIARSMTCDSAALLTAVLYGLLPFNFGLASVYTNQHAAIFFFLAGIFILFSRKSDKLSRLLLRASIAAVSFAISQLIRPELVIFILAAAATLIALLPSIFRDMKSFLHALVTLFAFISVFYGVFFSISGIFVATGRSNYGLVNRFPLWKFVVGFNQSSYGQYPPDDAKLLFAIEDPEERNALAKQLISERISVPADKIISLFMKKESIIWSADSNYWAFRGTNRSLAPKFMSIIDGLMLFSAYFFFTHASLKRILCPIVRWRELLLTIYIIGFAMAYLFIEVQSRYAYIAFPIIFVLAFVKCNCNKHECHRKQSDL